jgi:hypothetical protein
LLAEFDYCLASPEGISIEKLNEFFGRFLKISQDAYIGRAGDKDPDPNNNDL